MQKHCDRALGYEAKERMVWYRMDSLSVRCVRGQVNSSGKPQTHWLPTPRGLTTVTSVCGPRLAPRAWTGPSSRSTTRRPAAKLSFSTREKETATASSRAGFHGVHGCRDGATRNVHEEAQTRRPTQTTESGQVANACLKIHHLDIQSTASPLLTAVSTLSRSYTLLLKTKREAL